MTSTIEARPADGGPAPCLNGGPAPCLNGGAAVRLLVALFRAYQLARSGRVSPCRFTPTCSQYAIEAVERHGARRGALLAIRRLGRCRPGGPSGYDPVPAACPNEAAACPNGITE